MTTTTVAAITSGVTRPPPAVMLWIAARTGFMRRRYLEVRPGRFCVRSLIRELLWAVASLRSTSFQARWGAGFARRVAIGSQKANVPIAAPGLCRAAASGIGFFAIFHRIPRFGHGALCGLLHLFNCILRSFAHLLIDSGAPFLHL
jgi:hypothetical protein